MLQSILAVTICAEDLSTVESAYTKYLNYRVTERGVVSPVLAEHWRALLMAGRPYLLLQPESGAKVYLRFVQAPPVAGYEPLKTYGWNATEILVQDPDALAKRLAGSPFKIIGPPRNLSSEENIRAMQVLGPANELLYLTRVEPGSSALKLGSAATEVDQVFIVVCGNPELEGARRFYHAQLQIAVTPPIEVRISVLSNAHGIDPETLHPLALVELRETGLIELDQYPVQTRQRPQHEGELPPGLAMVSFMADSLEGMDARSLPGTPYHGRRSAMLQGVAGELIEVIES